MIESSMSAPSAIFPLVVFTTAPCLYNAKISIKTPLFKPSIASLFDKDLNELSFSTLYLLPFLACDSFSNEFS